MLFDWLFPSREGIKRYVEERMPGMFNSVLRKWVNNPESVETFAKAIATRNGIAISEACRVQAREALARMRANMDRE